MSWRRLCLSCKSFNLHVVLVQEEAVVVLDLEIKELEIHDLGAGGLGDWGRELEYLKEANWVQFYQEYLKEANWVQFYLYK